jgi:splicing factor 3A subunit 1
MTTNKNGVIGIILPPPTRKGIIDKTAQFVARTGRQVEEEILNQPQGKTAANFTFLLEDDPFHAYYLSKIIEFSSGQAIVSTKSETSSTTNQQVATSQTALRQSETGVPTTSTAATESISSAPVLRSSSLVDAFRNSSKKKGQEPQPFEFSLEKPVDATVLQVELIKLTAQFAATDGKKFESDLFHKEKSNETEFGFLNVNHPHHSYYSELVRCYRKLLENNIGWVLDLMKSESVLLDRAVHRFEFRRDEALKRMETDEKKALERLAFLEIDWHDFVVVETISFDEKPTEEPAKVEIELLVAEAADAARRAVNDDDKNDFGEIRKDYRVEPVRATLNVPMVTLSNGRQVPVSEMNEHVRAELLDPTKFREQQEKFEKRQRETNLVEGGSMPKHLARLAGARWDVFGGEREDAERRLEEAKRKEAAKVVWDGNMLTADSIRAVAASRNTSGVSLFPAPPIHVATAIAMPHPPQPSSIAFPPPPPSTTTSLTADRREGDIAEANKRLKVSTGGTSGYRVLVPAGGPGELGPNELDLQCAPELTVNDFKEMISAALSHIAVSKFQLKTHDGKFLKNSDIMGIVPKDSTIEVKWKSR